jgi:hypothetical protein
MLRMVHLLSLITSQQPKSNPEGGAAPVYLWCGADSAHH